MVIEPGVEEIWNNHRQIKARSPEAFGILIGSCEELTGHCRIESVTTPNKLDIQSRFQFLLKDPEHQKTVDQAYRQSQGHLGYLGTWHTHPETNPNPSTVDIKDWLKCESRNPDRPLFFVIVGTKNTCVFVRIKNKFVKLTRKEPNTQ